MTKNSAGRSGHAHTVFRAKKILTVDEVAALLEASLPTARRRLKAWKAHRSYNLNGRYYALPGAVRFDANGLWRCQGAGFSTFGNLTQTVVHLVCSARAGLRATELGALLGTRPHAFLSLFRTAPALRREKHQGRFVYFSADEARYAQQSKERQNMARGAELPGDAEAVAILVAAIKHPGLSTGQLCRQLETQAVVSTPQRIENLFAHHKLCLKKTPPSDS
jgi:hypothetical protein